MDQTLLTPQDIAKLRRESIAHSQGMGGVSWGSISVGSWLRDEIISRRSSTVPASANGAASAAASATTTATNTLQIQQPTKRPSVSNPPYHRGYSISPQIAYTAYLPNLEKQYCKDYSCCGLSLPGLHDLLRHYEEAHISTSPNTTNMSQIPMNSAGNTSSSVRMTNNTSSANYNLQNNMAANTKMQVIRLILCRLIAAMQLITLPLIICMPIFRATWIPTPQYDNLSILTISRI